MLPQVLQPDVINKRELTKGIVCTTVRKCLPIVYRAPRSMIHSHTIITVDSIMFGRDRRERDRAAVTAAKLESTYGPRIISGAVIHLTLMCSIFLSCHIDTTQVSGRRGRPRKKSQRDYAEFEVHVIRRRSASPYRQESRLRNCNAISSVPFRDAGILAIRTRNLPAMDRSAVA